MQSDGTASKDLQDGKFLPPELQQEINLKKEYPIRFRRSIKKSFWRLLSAIMITAICGLFLIDAVPEIQNPTKRELIKILLYSSIFGAVVWWLSQFVYHLAEQLSFQYRVSGGNLYLRKGFITKETGSFPLSRITDIYLHRGWGDFFWGLSSLHVSTPTASSGNFAYIHGLRIKDAEKMRARLEKLVKLHDMHMQSLHGALQQKREEPVDTNISQATNNSRFSKLD